MSGISEERLASIESALGGSSHGKQIHELIAEIRRLREVNRKRNHCVECGNLNPWQQCTKSGKWPGYGNTVSQIDPPGYMISRWESITFAMAATSNLN